MKAMCYPSVLAPHMDLSGSSTATACSINFVPLRPTAVVTFAKHFTFIRTNLATVCACDVRPNELHVKYGDQLSAR